VESETRARNFIGTVDAASEKTLSEAGAPPAFITALKTGAYSVPAGDLAAAQEQLAAETKRRAVQGEEARKFNTLYQAQQAQARAAAPLAAAPLQHALAPFMKGDLVTSKNGVLSTFNDQPIENKKLIGLYFSARWCGPCRKFTPQLVEFYNRVAAAHPEFEIVFVSNDRSGAAMESYMRDMQMPWPAISFAKIEQKLDLNKYAGDGIPCLVLIDASGKVVANSYEGGKYVGPSKVVSYLEQAFAVQTAAR
ncbi:MAG TPA: thioredoxin-like domain-containing protein, partial [Chthoniobacterales bacterium]